MRIGVSMICSKALKLFYNVHIDQVTSSNWKNCEYYNLFSDRILNLYICPYKCENVNYMKVHELLLTESVLINHVYKRATFVCEMSKTEWLTNI